ncbi:MAG: aconitate hydratase AcnA [bacterium]
MTTPANDPFDVRRTFPPAGGPECTCWSLPALEEGGVGPISRLPVSLRIVLESVLRHLDGETVTEEDVKTLANWDAADPAGAEIPFTVARVLMQDFTGVPAIVDLAAMRAAVDRAGKPGSVINPLVPVEMVIDHSVQVDAFGTSDALRINTEYEFERNRERYQFLKWGQQAFEDFRVVPPAIGICHQVNLEYLARGVFTEERDGERLCYFDTLVGTDSHTTMINGIGVVGWGVGGIEAEAALLGQPVTFLTPEVVGVHMSGELREGTTATDLVLTVTQLLRRTGVVGKFVEYFGEGVESLSLPDRATIANMSPEYGATMGFFPVDEQTLDYYRLTGRSEEQIQLIRDYFTAQGMFGIPKRGEVDYTQVLELDLESIEASVAGPRLPQDRKALAVLKQEFTADLERPQGQGGFGKPGGAAAAAFATQAESAADTAVAAADRGETFVLKHGDVVIAAITSCTNTSNPVVMMGAGLLARNAVEAGLTVEPYVKTSLAPGSRVVTDYLERSGLLPYLEQLGFDVVGYGCTTCIGNSGPLPEEVRRQVVENDLVTASVLSGNRNFEARVHPDVKASYLCSPPLVVAFALAGTVLKDLTTEPLGEGEKGQPVYLKDVWPSRKQIMDFIAETIGPESFREKYADIEVQAAEWNALDAPTGQTYGWDPGSTYIQEPPYFLGDFDPYEEPAYTTSDLEGARALLVLGDNVTTDHISPAGRFAPDTPAGKWLQARGVEPKDFNSYGSRRGNHEVMIRGTFANNRIKNRMVPGVEGGFTRHMPDGTEMTVFEAAAKYMGERTPLVVLAGENYGTGSSRDWAAKGTKLLGVRAVAATSYERIHRSNLVGMGVLPLQFERGESAEILGLDGTEVFSIKDLASGLEPGGELVLAWEKPEGATGSTTVKVRLDTPVEVQYYRHGGILDFVLRRLIEEA